MRLVRGQERRGCFKVLFPPTELAQESLVEPTTSSTCAGTRHLNARAGTTNCWAPIDSFDPELPELERMGSETVLAPPATPRISPSYSSYSYLGTSSSTSSIIIIISCPNLKDYVMLTCSSHCDNGLVLAHPSLLPFNPFSINPSGTPVLCCPICLFNGHTRFNYFT